VTIVWGRFPTKEGLVEINIHKISCFEYRDDGSTIVLDNGKSYECDVKPDRILKILQNKVEEQ